MGTFSPCCVLKLKQYTRVWLYSTVKFSLQQFYSGACWICFYLEYVENWTLLEWCQTSTASHPTSSHILKHLSIVFCQSFCYCQQHKMWKKPFDNFLSGPAFSWFRLHKPFSSFSRCLDPKLLTNISAHNCWAVDVWGPCSGVQQWQLGASWESNWWLVDY